MGPVIQLNFSYNIFCISAPLCYAVVPYHFLVWPFITFIFFFFLQDSVSSKRSSSASPLLPGCSFALYMAEFCTMRLLRSVYRGWIMHLPVPFWWTRQKVSDVTCLDTLGVHLNELLISWTQYQVWSLNRFLLDLWVLFRCFANLSSTRTYSVWYVRSIK